MGTAARAGEGGWGGGASLQAGGLYSHAQGGGGRGEEAGMDAATLEVAGDEFGGGGSIVR